MDPRGEALPRDLTGVPHTTDMCLAAAIEAHKLNLCENWRIHNRIMVAAHEVCRTGKGRWDCEISRGQLPYYDSGFILADGTVVQSKEGIGVYRAVIHGATSRAGGIWEGRMMLHSGRKVYIFLCVGKPSLDTHFCSENVLVQSCSSEFRHIRGLRERGPHLGLSRGDTLLWQFDSIRGRLNARVEGRSPMLQLFDGVSGGDVYCGFFLSTSVRIRLLDFRCAGERDALSTT